MKSTTIRFADPVYERLEEAGAATGLPINSIVVVACLDWLEKNQSSSVRGYRAARDALKETDPEI